MKSSPLLVALLERCHHGYQSGVAEERTGQDQALLPDAPFDNTVIIYTGDQGDFLGEHDLMDKRWMYEESMRMPFIVHYPKMIKAGSANNWLINNTDFAPTILELAGVATPASMQGRSFVPALKGDQKPQDWRTVTYYRYWMHMAHRLAVPAHFGVRSDRYKLMFFHNPPVAWEFYDLQQLPHPASRTKMDRRRPGAGRPSHTASRPYRLTQSP